ncbi:MAG TPA: tetratricopeptide repeat protein [Armatimonadota bacterium]|nr:tetratricopeptide repeat protein [Armatimonadota bacterium]
MDDQSEALVLEAIRMECLCNTQAAIDCYRRAVEHAPEMSDYCRFKIASLLVDQGETEAAIAECQIAVRIAPNDPGVCRDLASILSQIGRVKDAVEAYRMALRLEPGDFEALRSLSALLLNLGEFLEAAELLRAAVGYAEDGATAALLQFKLGCALMHSGMQKEANDAWTVIVEMAEAPTWAQEQARAAISGWPMAFTEDEVGLENDPQQTF